MRVVVLAVSLSSGIIGLVLVAICSLRLYCRRKKNDDEELNIDLDLPLFDLPRIIRATNNFSVHNKLGEGGFGAVYKVKTQETV